MAREHDLKRFGGLAGRAQQSVGEIIRQLPRRAASTICSARRRRFSIMTMRSVIDTAHNSPIVSGCTS